MYSTRVGNWSLFIESIRDITNSAFAYDKYNYSRYFLVFLREMLQLPSSHPEIYETFKAGHFCVQLSKENTFVRNESDNTIENTMNKDIKTLGGLAGFGLNQAATDRWVLPKEEPNAIESWKIC